ncbi:MAG: hypothetical protein V3U75_10005 [Methylococcaceae bacterium]
MLVPIIATAVDTAPVGKAKKKKKKTPDFHHVVDVKPSDAKKIPKALKLSPKGKLHCKTCHGLKDIKDKNFEKVDKKAKNFLRGGPYPKLTDFCYRCHDKKANKRPNIHMMLDKKGEIKKEHCLFCHKKVLKRDREIKLDEIKLRQPMEQICYGCHLKAPHFNAAEHQVKPKEKSMVKHLKKSSKRQGVFMPLSKKGKVMCITCHTPHPKGVLDAKKPAAKQVDNTDLEKGITYRKHSWSEVYQNDKVERLAELQEKTGQRYKLGYKRLDKEVLLRLPAKDGTLCLSCHQFDK